MKKESENNALNNSAKTLDKKVLTSFKELIIKKRDEVLAELEVLRERASESTVTIANGNNAAYAYHMADLGTDAMEREKAFLLLSRESQYLEKLDSALRRIEDGTYGICRSCNNPIDEERLKAVIVTTQCVRCKTKNSY